MLTASIPVVQTFNTSFLFMSCPAPICYNTTSNLADGISDMTIVNATPMSVDLSLEQGLFTLFRKTCLTSECAVCSVIKANSLKEPLVWMYAACFLT